MAAIAMAHPEDEVRLERASAVLDDLYELFRRSGPELGLLAQCQAPSQPRGERGAGPARYCGMRIPSTTAHHHSQGSSLQKTLDRYESGKFSVDSRGRSGVQVPNTHKPGPLPGVVLPKVPNRPKGVTEIEAVFTVDQYKGIVHGRNGDHEIIEGHITLVNAVGNKKVIDTKNVELAMNVASKRDPNGLPSEMPVKPGDLMEVEGEYIPAKQANAHNQNGTAAVIHFTHSPAGYVILPDGREFK